MFQVEPIKLIPPPPPQKKERKKTKTKIKKIVTINNKNRIESRWKQYKTIKGSKISCPIITRRKKKEKIRKKKQWEENDEAIASCFRARWIFDNCETRSTGLSTLIY